RARSRSHRRRSRPEGVRRLAPRRPYEGRSVHRWPGPAVRVREPAGTLTAAAGHARLRARSRGTPPVREAHDGTCRKSAAARARHTVAMSRDIDIVIAGAGIAGLTAAALLATGDPGGRLRIRIVDAGSRPRFDEADDVALRVSAISAGSRSEEHTSELQSRENLVC